MEWEGLLLLLSQGVNCLMARLLTISGANDWVNAKKIRGNLSGDICQPFLESCEPLIGKEERLSERKGPFK